MEGINWDDPISMIIAALERELAERGMDRLSMERVAAALDLDAALQELGREVSDEEFARLADGLAERYKEVKRHA